MVTGGGTGGHVFPALTVLEAAQRLSLVRPDEVVYVGTARGIEQELVPPRGIRLATVSTAPLVGRALWRLPAAALRIARGMVQSFRLARRWRPAVLLATGGYVSVPVVLGARLAGVRALIYLPDIHPGLAVRFLSRFASLIAVTDPAARGELPARKVVVTGYPVREGFLRTDQAAARRALDLEVGLPVALVLGGSQGAHAVNQALLAHLPGLLEIAQVVHVTGVREFEAVRGAAEALPAGPRARYRPYPFLDAEMPLAFAAADLVVCRAGASVLGELPVAGKPAVLIPGSFAHGHQLENARRLADAGAGAILTDPELDRLVPLIVELLGDRERLAQMAAAARQLARPDAAERIARLLVVVAQGGQRAQVA